MGDRKRKLAKPAALSAIAAASLAGAPSASAQECIPPNCENPPSPAFLKLTQLGFPGATELVFSKVESPGKEFAFLKVRELGFPGNTEDVFLKFIKID